MAKPWPNTPRQNTFILAYPSRPIDFHCKRVKCKIPHKETYWRREVGRSVWLKESIIEKIWVGCFFNTWPAMIDMVTAGMDMTVSPVHHHQNSFYWSFLNNWQAEILKMRMAISVFKKKIPQSIPWRFHGPSWFAPMFCSLGIFHFFIFFGTVMRPSEVFLSVGKRRRGLTSL